MKTLINLLTVTALLGLSACGEKTPGDAAEKPPTETAETAAALPDRVEVSAEAQKESGLKTEVLRRASVPETFQAMGRVMQDAQKPHHIMAGGAGRLETVSGVLGQAIGVRAVFFL